MREIKFRGMDIVNNKWLYGNLEIPLINQSKSKYFIIGYSYGQYQKHEVDPKTVGQYTGLKDKNGREIYEGDIVINTGLWYLPSTVKIQHVKERYGEGEIFVVNFNITGVELRHKDNWVMDKEKQFLPNGFIGRPYVDNHDAWNYQKSLEIIGNIYEHPELLEGDLE